MATLVWHFIRRSVKRRCPTQNLARNTAKLTSLTSPESLETALRTDTHDDENRHEHRHGSPRHGHQTWTPDMDTQTDTTVSDLSFILKLSFNLRCARTGTCICLSWPIRERCSAWLTSWRSFRPRWGRRGAPGKSILLFVLGSSLCPFALAPRW